MSTSRPKIKTHRRRASKLAFKKKKKPLQPKWKNEKSDEYNDLKDSNNDDNNANATNNNKDNNATSTTVVVVVDNNNDHDTTTNNTNDNNSNVQSSDVNVDDDDEDDWSAWAMRVFLLLIKQKYFCWCIYYSHSLFVS